MPTLAISGQTTFGSNTSGTTTQLDNNFLLAYNALNNFNQYTNYLVDSGAANAYVVTAPAGTTITLSAGLAIQFKATNANTAASTLNATGSAKNILNPNGTALTAAQIPANSIVSVMYDGTQWLLTGLSLASGTHATTFTWDGSGSTTGSITLGWQKINTIVTLYIPALSANTGTGSTALSNDTALPTYLRPSANSQFSGINNIKNGTVGIAASGLVRITTAGILSVFRDNAATAFTNGSAGGTSSDTSIQYYVG